jgi:hypothetical protein
MDMLLEQHVYSDRSVSREFLTPIWVVNTRKLYESRMEQRSLWRLLPGTDYELFERLMR